MADLINESLSAGGEGNWGGSKIPKKFLSGISTASVIRADLRVIFISFPLPHILCYIFYPSKSNKLGRNVTNQGRYVISRRIQILANMNGSISFTIFSIGRPLTTVPVKSAAP